MLDMFIRTSCLSKSAKERHMSYALTQSRVRTWADFIRNIERPFFWKRDNFVFPLMSTLVFFSVFVYLLLGSTYLFSADNARQVTFKPFLVSGSSSYIECFLFGIGDRDIFQKKTKKKKGWRPFFSLLKVTPRWAFSRSDWPPQFELVLWLAE